MQSGSGASSSDRPATGGGDLASEPATGGASNQRCDPIALGLPRAPDPKLFWHPHGHLLNIKGERVDEYGRHTRPRGVPGAGRSWGRGLGARRDGVPCPKIWHQGGNWKNWKDWQDLKDWQGWKDWKKDWNWKK